MAKHDVKIKNKSKEVLFILFIATGVLYLTSLLTHSAYEIPWSGDVRLDGAVVNKAGIIGAYISDISLSILGYGSYIIPIALIWLSFRVRLEKENNGFFRLFLFVVRFMALIALIVFSSALLSQYAPEPAGGWIGQIVDEYFSLLFGAITVVIYLSIVMVSFSVAGHSSWSEVVGSIVGFFSKIFVFIGALYKKIKAIKLFTFKKKKKDKANVSVISKSIYNTKIQPKKDEISNPVAANLFSAPSVQGLPELSLLNEINTNQAGYSKQELESMSAQVKLKLKDFGFEVEITGVAPGPVVTQFEVSLAPGVKVSQIINLSKDLARALLVESVRIVDAIPGKPVIGIEIPNVKREIISLKEILSSQEFVQSRDPLTIGLGKNINGTPVIANLAKMPHLLVAGATGMGKSVGLNAIILSVLYKATPEQVRIIMIDPKIVELACYKNIPHLLTPVVTDMNQAASALFWCVNEMERRYLLLAKFAVRNIEGFNQKLIKAKEGDTPLLDPFFNADNAAPGETAAELEELPLIMVVIDEYADMLGALAQEDRTKSKRVESLIIRLAQKARAAGIHLIIATQRPSVDVITGLIKSNIPTRIAFKVASKIDSRTVLDQGGADQLLGMGDMLYMTPGVLHLNRIHGAFVDDDEINRVVDFLKQNSQTNYLNNILSTPVEGSANTSANIEGELDELYDEAVEIVTSTRRASISSLQRRMRIGYNRAARIIEDMEASGVVSSMNSAGSREVLAPKPVADD